MDPLAVLAGMDAMDAAGVPVEEIPDSDGEFDDRSLEGSDVDVLSSDEEELLDDELLGDGTSSGASGDSSQSGTEDSDEDSDEQNDGGAVRGRGRGAVRGRGRGARGGRGRGRGLGRGNPVGRGRGNLRGRGRGGRGRGAGGRGRGRGGAHANYDAAFGYNDEDDGGLNGFPQFTPDTEPGLNLPEDFHPTCESDFFKLFFSPDVVDSIVLYTNAYAVAHIAAKPTYANANGQWTPTTRDEMYSFLALLLFQAYLKLPDMGDYWSTESLFDGNYARSMIPSRKRFKALLTFLKIVDHEQEDPDDRLRKVRFLYDTVCEKCQSLFVPGQCLSVDERMIKHKGRAVFKQYLPKKPVKWGFKVFAVCDADTGMLCKFEIYTGQAGANDCDGLTHAVVLRLTEHLAGAGRILFTDNFYTSPALAESLLERGSHLVGTVRTNRRGYPMQLKTDLKNFEKHAERGETRYVREGNILVQQWKDRRVVSMLSTVHRGDSHVMVTRHTKVNGQHVELNIRQPTCVRDYNKNMGGVDTFDQRAAAYRTLRRTNKYWKSIFLDIIDIVAVNSFLLFQLFRQQNPGVIERPRQYRRRHFHSNLIRQLAKIDVNAPPPKRRYRPSTGQQPPAAHLHLPGHRVQKRNCVYCWDTDHVQRKCVSFCRTCEVHLHTSGRDCFANYHLQHF